MDALIVAEKDALNVFDRGYVDYRKFDTYSEKGIHFVTRLKQNAVLTILEEKPVPPGSSIIREAIVRLGSPQTYQMTYALRLIETVDSKGNLICIITNEMEMSAEELGEVYRKRWQIELFFKWIKQHLTIKRCYGRSDVAVYNQLRIALITFCLTLLMKRRVANKGTLLDVQKLLQLCWDKDFQAFVRKLCRPPTRRSKGRRFYAHERLFKETLAQYERGETDHLNDLTYDPII